MSAWSLGLAAAIFHRRMSPRRMKGTPSMTSASSMSLSVDQPGVQRSMISIEAVGWTTLIPYPEMVGAETKGGLPGFATCEDVKVPHARA